jgi:hypothetical protein
MPAETLNVMLQIIGTGGPECSVGFAHMFGWLSALRQMLWPVLGMRRVKSDTSLEHYL